MTTASTRTASGLAASAFAQIAAASGSGWSPSAFRGRPFGDAQSLEEAKEHFKTAWLAFEARVGPADLAAAYHEPCRSPGQVRPILTLNQ